MTILEVIATLKANLKQTDIILYPGASEQLIQRFEEEMNLSFPIDFKMLYMFCNGFESTEDMFRIIPLEEILEYKHELQPKQFYLAEYLIYSDTWEVEVDGQNISSYQISNTDSYKKPTVLTDSLAVFIYRFLQGGVYDKNGLVAWPDEIRGRNSQL